MKKFFRTLAIVLCLSVFTPSVIPNIGTETVQAATKIKLNYTKKTIYVGKSFKLKITGTKKKVKWSSSNKTIATVSSKGVVKGIGEGTAKITAKVGKKKYTCKVNVNIIIKLNQTNLKLNEGDTYQLNTIEETKQKIEWRSSNPEIATVDSNGLVKAINGGDDEKICDIIATIGGNEYICNVTVKKYTPPKSVVTYISDRSVEYVSLDNVERFFFSLKDQNKNRISSYGTVDLRIENDGVIVYQKTVEFSPIDFGYWTNKIYGERYLCSIDIPISDIQPGKNNSGILYYKINEEDASFDEYSLNINNLPQKTATINLPQLPYTVLESVLIKDINGRYQHALCDININDIKTKIDGSHVKLTFTGNVTPTIDTITWVGSNSYYFTVKLIKDGVVVDSKMAMTPSIYLNDKFSCDVSFFDLDNTSEYTVQLCSYD